MKKIGIFLITIVLTLILCSGCSKDSILNIYQKFNENLGDFVLTNSFLLRGHREFDKDHYTGTYEVNYQNFKGAEVIFGGTTIDRDDNNIHVKIEVSNSKGELKVYMKLKEKQEILATEDGFYEFDFNVKSGSNYLIINGNDYSGEVKIKID